MPLRLLEVELFEGGFDSTSGVSESMSTRTSPSLPIEYRLLWFSCFAAAAAAA